MAGYWQRPDETAKVIDANGWLATGDIGVMDDRGFVRIVDRKKDMILVSGFTSIRTRSNRSSSPIGRAGMRRHRRTRREVGRGGEAVRRPQG